MEIRSIKVVVPALAFAFLAGCSGGSGGNGTPSCASPDCEPASAPPPAFASKLIGTWRNLDVYEGEVHYRFDSDGTCVAKSSSDTAGSISNACTYSVTGDASNPTPNSSWIVLMSGPHVASSKEIIAIDANAFTTRDGDQRTDYGRVAPVEMHVCSGTAVACESLDATTCETTGGCETKQGCAGPSGSGCDAYSVYGCLEHDECNLIDTCGTLLYEGCQLSPDDCITRPGCSLSE